VALHPKRREQHAAGLKDSVTKDAKEFEGAISLFEEAIYGETKAPLTERAESTSRADHKSKEADSSRTLRQEKRSSKEGTFPSMGETMQFWSNWSSKNVGSKRHPAWHSSDSPERGIIAKTRGKHRGFKRLRDAEKLEEGFRNARKPAQPKTWAQVAAAQALAAATEAGTSVPVSGAALDSQVLYNSRHRLQRMIRAGQKELVREEMRVSLNLPPINGLTRKDTEKSPIRQTKEEKSPRSKSSTRSKILSQESNKSNAEVALKRMGKQRGELQKVRRALEQVVDGDKWHRAAGKLDDALRRSIKERRSILVVQADDDDDDDD